MRGIYTHGEATSRVDRTKAQLVLENPNQRWAPGAVVELVLRDPDIQQPDQIDAVLCAYTAWCYNRGRVRWFGTPGEGLIIVPATTEPEAERNTCG